MASIPMQELFAVHSQSDLFKSETIPFDLYIRLVEGKTIKIKHKDAPTDRKQIDGYIARGCRFFYIPKDQGKELYERISRELPLPTIEMSEAEMQKAADCLESCLATVFMQAGTSLDDMSNLVKVAGTVSEIAKLHSSFLALLQRVFRGSEYALQHSVDVAVTATQIYLALESKPEGLSVNDVFLAGLLHDIAISELCEAPYSPYLAREARERGDLLAHSIIAAEILDKLKLVSDNVVDGIEQHHERLDATGAPYGLKDDQIVPIARILSVADEYHVIRDNLKDGSVVIRSAHAIEQLKSQTDKFDSKMIECLAKLNDSKNAA